MSDCPALHPHLSTNRGPISRIGPFLLLVTLAAASLAGCTAPQQQGQSAILPTSEYDLAYAAALQVISRDYTIAQASPVEGLIRTKPLEFVLEGAERQAGAYISSGDQQRHRRIVSCRIRPIEGAAGVRAEVMVDLERESTTQAERLIITQDGRERPGLGVPQRLDYVEEQRAIHWGYVGRDKEAEAALLHQIAQRVTELQSNEAPLPPPVPVTPAPGS